MKFLTLVFAAVKRHRFMSLDCCLPLYIGWLWLVFSMPLLAQNVSFSGAAPSVDFGSINLCFAGKTTPAPCSETLTLTYKVTESGTLGTPKVLTLGAPNLDFKLAGGSTCTGSVSVGTTCSVKVMFAPKLAGGRPGAVQITSEAGKVLLTTPVYGSGIGAQVGTTLNGSYSSRSYTDPGLGWFFPTQPAVDGAANVFLATTDNHAPGGSVLELPARGGAQVVLPFDFAGTSGPAGGQGGFSGDGPAGLAVDGAGDVFVTTYSSGASEQGLVLELPAGGGATITLPFNGLINPAGLAVDGSGNVYVLDAGVYTSPSSRVIKLPFGCKSSSCQTTVASYYSISEMTADVAGDLFLLYSATASDTSVLEEFPATGKPPTLIATAPEIDGLAMDGVGDLFSTVSIPTPYGSGDYDEVDIVAAEFPTGGGMPFTNQYLASYGDGYEDYPTAFTADLSGNLYVTNNPGQAQQSLAIFSRSQFAPLNFGSIPVGTTTIQQLNVTNTGDQTLVLTPSFRSASYSLKGAEPEGCLQGTPSGQSCTLEVEFSALTQGSHNITLTLGTNGATDATVLLEGVATNP